VQIAPFWCLCGLLVAGCGLIPSSPGVGDVQAQAKSDHEIAFDVVKVDDKVLATVLAQPHPRFASLFAATPPPQLHIAVGDRIAVVIWEAGAGGLFTEAPPVFAAPGLETEPLTPAPGAPSVSPGEAPSASALTQAAAAAVEEEARAGVRIPDQIVAFDGAISVPFAGRVPAAGQTPQEVAHAIEQRLAEKALTPQALVLDLQSESNAVTVAGDAVHGARVPLNSAGERLLQVIAAAGGAGAKTQDVTVRLTRGGVTAAIPLAALVENPAEDIYAWPGDALTLTQAPKTFAVFGATTANRLLAFNAPHVALSEALARVHGLDDDRANPRGVFVFRYEPLTLVKALDMPPATHATGGVAPVVYRFDWLDPKAYLLAGRFPMHDKDVIFVADSDARGLYQFVDAFNNLVGGVETGLLACYSSKC
jgi:polysaccharide biosynthesis/export protein